jgi:predicted dehydrogenase/nucleoside-diphosphate-sugar epimerase
VFPTGIHFDLFLFRGVRAAPDRQPALTHETMTRESLSATPNKSGSSGALRIGIAGAGKMAQAHARAILRTPGAALVGYADPTPAAREAMRAIAPPAAGFASLDELLRDGALDVVHVCTPPANHRAVATDVLRAGCSVYVEKPFAETVADTEAILSLAQERGLKVCAGHQLLFEPPSRVLKGLRPSLGRLAHVESYFSFRTIRRSPGGRVPLSPDLQLLDILPHPVYLLLSVLGAESDGPVSIESLEVGNTGTVHALVRRGNVTGVLVVTLEGRPVESYLRLIGTNGSVFADFVRSTVQRQIGPGTSGIDKLLAPYRQARQLAAGTTAALGKRFLKRQRSYPGLVELFTAFYDSVRNDAPSPVSPDSILETVRICEEVARAIDAREKVADTIAPRLAVGRQVVVTGGTGFLGKEVVRALVTAGNKVRVLARRLPATWDRATGAEYVVADLGVPLPPDLMRDAEAVIHCAAETAGGWQEHQRNSLDATEHMVRAAAAAGIDQFIHVSSLAVLAPGSRTRPVDENTPLDPDSRTLGPYAWGKIESEKLAVTLGESLGVHVKVVRPGALIDYANFEPPGRLGRRIGNILVAVGSPSSKLGVVDVAFSGRLIAWMLDHFDETPSVLNLLSPDLPTRRQLVGRLKQDNPDLTCIWLPTYVLVPMSWLAMGLQKVLRPKRPAVNPSKVFASQSYDTRRIAALEQSMRDATAAGAFPTNSPARNPRGVARKQSASV